MFIHFNNKIVPLKDISHINYSDFAEHGHIHVFYKLEMNIFSPSSDCVEGADAVRLIMELCPGALEGKKAKHIKHSWAIHNLIGHPLMQICSWLHLPHLGIKIHDYTAPAPIIEK